MLRPLQQEPRSLGPGWGCERQLWGGGGGGGLCCCLPKYQVPVWQGWRGVPHDTCADSRGAGVTFQEGLSALFKFPGGSSPNRHGTQVKPFGRAQVKRARTAGRASAVHHHWATAHSHRAPPKASQGKLWFGFLSSTYLLFEMSEITLKTLSCISPEVWRPPITSPSEKFPHHTQLITWHQYMCSRDACWPGDSSTLYLMAQ